MKFNIVITILFCTVLLAGMPSEIHAQKKRGSEEETKLIDKLWFGGNIGLGFNNSQFGSRFFIGLAPMVGYKITDEWSVGPRVDLSYTYLTFPSANMVEKINYFNIGAAIFTRYKVFSNFFAHIESGINNIPYLDRDAMGNLIVVREQRQTVFVGIGYTAGGGEIVLLYDLNAPQNTAELPFDFRFGFNYNF